MADKTHADSRKVAEFNKNISYPEEILSDKGEESNFRKASKNFSAVNGHLMYKD